MESMFPALDQIIKYYRDVLAVNDQQMFCCNPVYPANEVPDEIACHSLSILEPLLHYSLQPGDRILDIGCGAGADCFLAAIRGGSRVRAFGVDVVDELVTRANELKMKYDIKNVEFLSAVLPPIPFESALFDLVIMNYSFHLFEDKSTLLQEIARVLKNGGKAIIADGFSPKDLNNVEQLENWLMAAGSAVSTEQFARMSASAGLDEIKFIKEKTPHLPKSEVIGYMVCSKKQCCGSSNVITDET